MSGIVRELIPRDPNAQQSSHVWRSFFSDGAEFFLKETLEVQQTFIQHFLSLLSRMMRWNLIVYVVETYDAPS